MTRRTGSHSAHSASVDAFARAGDFSEQLHDALRKSPWWMVSIAFHVVLALLLSSFTTTVEAAPKPKPMHVSPTEDLPEEEPPEDPEPVEPIVAQDFRTEEPIVSEVPLEEPSTENEADTLDVLGESDDKGTGPMEGPHKNGLIGGGGGASGAFGKRPGRAAGGPGGRSGSGREDAVLDGLRWLAAHQSPDGGWEAAGFAQWCDGKPNAGEKPDGPGGAFYDVGVTGLALCAFLGAGYTHRGEHPFVDTVRRGLRYLRSAQDAEGCFGPRSSAHYIYNHATASLAMVEAFGMTESPIFKSSAQKALDFICLARNPYFAWRYGVKPGDNDTSVMGWMMMALKSARLVNGDAVRRGRPAPLLIDEEAFDGMRAWLDKMTDPDYGRVGYVTRGSGPSRSQEMLDRFPAEKSESLTAVGVLARCFLGDDPRKDAMIQKGAALMSRLPPVWNPNDGSIDMYYWYYATLAMFQVGGSAWKDWDTALNTSIVAHQRKDGTFCAFKGSWDPIDPWSPEGGRVYSTALLTMCLEVLYRYDRVIGTK